jgi:hypothetical protein
MPKKLPRAVNYKICPDAVQSRTAKKKTTIVRSEELTTDEPAGLAEKIEAARQRRRPPSIWERADGRSRAHGKRQDPRAQTTVTDRRLHSANGFFANAH